VVNNKQSSPTKEISNNQPTSKSRPHPTRVRPSTPHLYYEHYCFSRIVRELVYAFIGIYSFSFVDSTNENTWHISSFFSHFGAVNSASLSCSIPVRNIIMQLLVFIPFHSHIMRLKFEAFDDHNIRYILWIHRLFSALDGRFKGRFVRNITMPFLVFIPFHSSYGWINFGITMTMIYAIYHGNLTFSGTTTGCFATGFVRNLTIQYIV
jgi:hypothetical protein